MSGIYLLNWFLAALLSAVPSVQHVDGWSVEGDPAGGDGENDQGMATAGQRSHCWWPDCTWTLSAPGLLCCTFVRLTYAIIIITSTEVEFMQSMQFFSQSFCMQDYCKSNQPISLKPDVMVGPTNRKNRLAFGGDVVPNVDTGSLFRFLPHCGTGDFRSFISISHTTTGRFSRHLPKWSTLTT